MAFAESREPSGVATREQEMQPFSWRKSIVYEAYPTVVAPDSGKPGAKSYLQVLTENLENKYYQKLHVGALWLNPIYYDGGGRYDMHYDVADHKALDTAEFGNMAQFRKLVRTAHDQGIKIVMDLVANHCSSLDADYQEAISTPDNAKQEMFLFYEDIYGGPPTQEKNAFGEPVWQEVMCGAGTATPKKKWVYTSFHAEGQRDYNWASPLVQAKMKGIIEFWRNEGVDGFRGDALPFIKEREADPAKIIMMNGPHAFDHIKQIAQWIGPGGVLIPEGSMDDTVARLREEHKAYPKDEQVQFRKRKQILAALDKMTYHDLADSATCEISPIYFLPYFLNWHDASSMKLFHDTFYAWLADPKNAGEAHAFQISDHDTGARGFSRLGSYLTARAAKMESYRAPMTVMYAGDELGQKNAVIANPTDIVGRDRARQRLEIERLAQQQGDPASEWSFTQQLGWIKQNVPAYTQGEYIPLPLGKDIYGYVLHHESGDLLIVHTTSTEEAGVEVNIPGLSESAKPLLSNYINKEVSMSGTTLHLRPQESVIIRL